MATEELRYISDLRWVFSSFSFFFLSFCERITTRKCWKQVLKVSVFAANEGIFTEKNKPLPKDKKDFWLMLIIKNAYQVIFFNNLSLCSVGSSQRVVDQGRLTPFCRTVVSSPSCPLLKWLPRDKMGLAWLCYRRLIGSLNDGILSPCSA